MYNDLDVEKEELEVDIEELLTEYKTEEDFKFFQHGFTKDQIPEDSKVGKLMNKMMERHRVLAT
jgi:hypothetical protein